MFIPGFCARNVFFFLSPLFLSLVLAVASLAGVGRITFVMAYARHETIESFCACAFFLFDFIIFPIHHVVCVGCGGQ